MAERLRGRDKERNTDIESMNVNGVRGGEVELEREEKRFGYIKRENITNSPNLLISVVLTQDVSVAAFICQNLDINGPRVSFAVFK